MAYPSDLVRTKNWGTETLTDTDLEGQFDLIITWLDAMADETTGHSHDGTSNEGPQIILSGAGTGVTGTLGLANGGTGQTTLAGLLNLVYPVGSYYFNDSDSTNPGTLLGFGTWVAVEETVLAGYKAGGTFDPVGDLAEGEETHTLTEAEMPAHTHTVQTYQVSGTGANAGNTSLTSGGQTPSTGSTGSGTAHNNIQPTRVVYMWRRTV